MSNILYQMLPVKRHAQGLNWSERKAAELAKVSRSTWRAVALNKTTVSISTLESIAESLGQELTLLLCPPVCQSDFSTIAVSLYVLKDGSNSWKIHYMNLVDEFRRSMDPRLLLLPPSNTLSLELRALLASIVITLANEVEIDPPFWAKKRFDLSQPWFVAQTESLKATALLESPLPFRRNNIFVLSNFMERR